MHWDLLWICLHSEARNARVRCVRPCVRRCKVILQVAKEEAHRETVGRLVGNEIDVPMSVTHECVAGLGVARARAHLDQLLGYGAEKRKRCGTSCPNVPWTPRVVG